MIQLTLTQALALYATVIALMAAGIWIYTLLGVHRPQRGMGKQFLWRCTFCGFTYLDNRSSEYSECPQCHSIIAATDRGAREVYQPAKPDERSTPDPEPQPIRNPSRRKRPHARTRGPRRRR